MKYWEMDTKKKKTLKGGTYNDIIRKRIITKRNWTHVYIIL